ncbi:MAG TPA: hypothetical protein PLA94_21290 [Myxococcota bacterium]|nr:hypothetical protein [Myxococcota bacterium]HND32550.1 hypothetical protein [Myxococcota bacterium]
MRSVVLGCLLLAGCGNTGANKNGDESGGDSTSTGSACSPKASCTAGAECLNIADNSDAARPGLRVAQLSISTPSALASGIVAGVFAGAVEPHAPACNLSGTGFSSLLLQFDKAAGTITLGGSKPVADPSGGYSFVNETVDGMPVAPVTMQGTIDETGAFAVTSGVNVILPFYLDNTTALLFPLRKVTTNGTLSSDNNCIGTYNAKGLDPANGCLSTADTPAFLNGGNLDGYMALEDADLVVLSSVQASLCVILSGDATQYGDGASPAKCKRGRDGAILYHGDWCDATNAAASGDCFDSVRFQSAFSASGVDIL